jgi:hypothetical protein
MTFSGGRDELILSGPWGHLRASTGNPDDWRFWPTSFEMPEPGCYGVQIDTLLGSEVLIVEYALIAEIIGGVAIMLSLVFVGM